jgi:hypothetical protein
MNNKARDAYGDRDLVRRALAAYFRDARPTLTNNVPIPEDTDITVHDGKRYVVLKKDDLVLAVYRINNDGSLRQLVRWPAALDPHRRGLKADLTPEDWEAGNLAGATALEVFAAALNRALDQKGVPREGRSSTVTPEHEGYDSPGEINIKLPDGYDAKDLDDIDINDDKNAILLWADADRPDEEAKRSRNE